MRAVRLEQEAGCDAREGFRTGRWCAGAGWQEGYAGAAAAPVGLKRTGRATDSLDHIRRFFWCAAGGRSAKPLASSLWPTGVLQRAHRTRGPTAVGLRIVHARHTGLWLVSTVWRRPNRSREVGLPQLLVTEVSEFAGSAKHQHRRGVDVQGHRNGKTRVLTTARRHRVLSDRLFYRLAPRNERLDLVLRERAVDGTLPCLQPSPGFDGPPFTSGRQRPDSAPRYARSDGRLRSSCSRVSSRRTCRAPLGRGRSGRSRRAS